MKTFFKVLVGDKSCSVSDVRFETTYQEGKWVESPVKGTPLFVFDSLEHANNFAKGTNTIGVSPAKWEHASVFSCQVKNPRRAPRFIVSNLGFGLSEYWIKKLRKKNPDCDEVVLTRPVEGSFVCDAVKILKIVA